MISVLHRILFVYLVYATWCFGGEKKRFSSTSFKKFDSLTPLVVTPRAGFEEPIISTPWSTDRMEVGEIRNKARSMPEALTGLPSVMVQKTALGQSSPYIRGLTGYHNLLLVDGIRLNHSAMRSGPNQYWSTVEILGSERIEIVRGPNGIIHGADAIGGVVNVVSTNPSFSKSEITQGSDFFGRLSSAERSWSVGLVGNVSSSDWFAELSHAERSFGDLDGGRKVGKQINVGYDSRSTNFQLARKTKENNEITLGVQQSFMDDVPRTHKTVDGLTWEGLSPGSERWRRLDQQRSLYFGKFSWKNASGFADQGIATLSLHRHGQERNRMRKLTNGGDFQFFELDDYGLSVRLKSDDPWGGRIHYGADLHSESLTSGGYLFDDFQVRGSDLFQGTLAAHARYKRYSFYLNDSIDSGSGWIFEPGIRFSSVRAELERYYLKNTDHSTLQAPETKKYEKWIGSLRISKQFRENKFFFAGLSQGFRPPSTYDLTSTDETSINEAPNVHLSPENFTQAEVGLRGSSRKWYGQASVYHTWIKNMVVRSPYQATTGNTLALKSNGDGFVKGIEIALGCHWNSAWNSNLSFSWMDSEVEQLMQKNLGSRMKLVDHDDDESTAKIFKAFEPVDRATTRSMPTQIQFITRYSLPKTPWWGEFSILSVGKADDLSLKDLTDNSRIPQNGTPGYTLLGARIGAAFGEGISLNFAAENLSDEDYRVHGSGLNGSGRNFIISFTYNH